MNKNRAGEELRQLKAENEVLRSQNMAAIKEVRRLVEVIKELTNEKNKEIAELKEINKNANAMIGANCDELQGIIKKVETERDNLSKVIVKHCEIPNCECGGDAIVET